MIFFATDEHLLLKVSKKATNSQNRGLVCTVQEQEAKFESREGAQRSLVADNYTMRTEGGLIWKKRSPISLYKTCTMKQFVATDMSNVEMPFDI